VRIAPIKKLLQRQLEPDEVRIVIEVWKAEKRGEKYFAGRLGFAAHLERRNWLVRSEDNSLRLSRATRELFEQQREVRKNTVAVCITQ
jgi:ribosomal protein L21E